MEALRLSLLSLIFSLCILTTQAHPGTAKKTLDGLVSLAHRQTVSTTELLANLQALPDSLLSPAGSAIKNILLGNRAAASPQDLTTLYTPPGALGSAACSADACCVYSYAADDMAAVFREPSSARGGECTELARQAVRLAFHDAGTWSKTAGGGGADGSVILAGEWALRAENRGLGGIAPLVQALYDRYRPHGARMADLVQLAATVAAVSCPLGPRVRSFVGRNDSAVPAPEGRLPDVRAGAAELVALFADKTVPLGELIALIGAHSVSTQLFVDLARAGAPQDTTPGVWDVLWYNQTISEPPPPGVFRFPSDVALSRYPGAQDFWAVFMNSQAVWADAYAAAYVRLSVLGVEHVNALKECTGVLPLPVS
ncbi:class II peroxidase [Parathielavia hyrcaniae]|uniref:Peroxidase n=1 Tax=Parathielavia hyrcaniae TaxID=113614 RepID=A0AAN6Q0I5_9PEZI|nr:class II peroxidase [Parathielavia hyrcaniae]